MTVPALSGMLFSVLFLFCVIPSGDPEGEFLFHAVTDTIAPWGTLLLIFSEPLADSSNPEFAFEPPVYAYTLECADSRDTVLLRLSEPLKGNTRYLIHAEETIFSSRGVPLTPESDPVVVWTHAAEREPNDFPALADTLQGSSFGSIETVDDTDWYVVPEIHKTARITLDSYESQSTFEIHDQRGTITSSEIFKDSDTISVPHASLSPLLIAVFAYHRSAGGHYRILSLTK